MIKIKHLFIAAFVSNPVNKIGLAVTSVFGFIWAVVSSYYGGGPPFFQYALLCLGFVIVADTIAGAMFALREGEFSIVVFRSSMSKIILYTTCLLVLVPLGCMVRAMGITNDQYAIVGLMAAYLSTVELLSFMRITSKLGIKWPGPIKKLIDKISSELDTNEIVKSKVVRVPSNHTCSSDGSDE
jgi:phage-related holin